MRTSACTITLRSEPYLEVLARWRFGRAKAGGPLKVAQGLRPGVVAFSLGHGHWAYGAGDVMIDGQVVKGDPRRAAGFHANAALRVDPVIKNTTLSDLTGGSAVFYDTQVKLTKT